MSRAKIAIILGIVLLVVAAAVGYFVLRPSSDAAPPPSASMPAAPQGAVPEPKVVVIDMAAVLQMSKVGQDIGRQMQGFANQSRAELDTRGRALQSEAQQLQRQAATLSAEERQKRVAGLEARQASLRQEAQRKDNQLRTAFAQARSVIDGALGPIVKQIVAERGVNMVLDKRIVSMIGDGSLDITAETIAKLDAKVSSYKVTLPAEKAP